MDHGTATENLVERLCQRSFLADFVFRSPRYTTASGHQREAGDLLLPLKQTLIALQVRAKRVDESFDPASTIHLRRVQRRIAHAVNQVKTAKRSLESGALKELENLRGVCVPVRPTMYTRHVGVVVLDFNPVDESCEPLNVCILNGLSSVRDIPVHLFLRSDLETIVDEMNTLPDFLKYLDIRAALMNARRLSPFTQDLDLLAMIQTRYPDVEKILAGKVDHAVIEPGFWTAHLTQHTAQIAKRAKRRRLGNIVDKIIETAHRSIGYGDPEADEEWAREPGTVEDYMTIVQELAALSRNHRNSFGQRIIEKLRRADSDPRGYAYCAYVAGEVGTVYLFLACRLPRNELRRILVNLTSAIYVVMRDSGVARRAVGIGTQNVSATKVAQEFLFIPDEAECDDEDELRKIAAAAFGPVDIASEDEWGNRRQRKQQRRGSGRRSDANGTQC